MLNDQRTDAANPRRMHHSPTQGRGVVAHNHGGRTHTLDPLLDRLPNAQQTGGSAGQNRLSPGPQCGRQINSLDPHLYVVEFAVNVRVRRPCHCGVIFIGTAKQLTNSPSRPADCRSNRGLLICPPKAMPSLP